MEDEEWFRELIKMLHNAIKYKLIRFRAPQKILLRYNIQVARRKYILRLRYARAHKHV